MSTADSDAATPVENVVGGGGEETTTQVDDQATMVAAAGPQHGTRNKIAVEASETCGCYCCETIFAPSAITSWVDDGPSPSDQTANCPHCGIDSVIGSASGLPITPEFLHAMKAYWF